MKLKNYGGDTIVGVPRDRCFVSLTKTSLKTSGVAGFGAVLT